MKTCPACGKTYELEDAEVETFECQECEEFSDEDDGPLYECSSCGHVYTRGATDNDNHICPQCHRFGSRQADMGCPKCQAGELLLVTLIRCPHCETVRMPT